jgi:hypothetical protein
VAAGCDGKPRILVADLAGDPIKLMETACAVGEVQARLAIGPNPNQAWQLRYAQVDVLVNNAGVSSRRHNPSLATEPWCGDTVLVVWCSESLFDCIPLPSQSG